MKTCAKCKIEKDESEFHRQTPTRIHSYCKVCRAELCNKEKAREATKRYQQRNPAKTRAGCREYKKKNKEKIKEYYKKNRARTAAYYQKRRKDDTVYALKVRVSRRVRHILMKAFGVNKSRVTNKIIGCTGTELLAHLVITSVEELDGMHVDHQCPLSCALTEEEVYKLNHYSNLRIIPAAENLAKSDNWSEAGAMLHLILLGREWIKPPTTEKA